MPDWDKMGYGSRAGAQQIGDFRFTTVSPGVRLPAGNRW
jgi:hypothetical protein